MIHVKVKASAVAGVLCAVLTACQGMVGVGTPPWVSSLCTALVAALAGYATPSAGHAVSQDNGE